MNTSHAKAIKGMSIANIVLGALGLLGCLFGWMGIGAFTSYVASTGYDYFYTEDGYIIEVSDINALLAMLGFLVFWMIVCYVIVLVAGIMGVRGAAKPEKLKGVMIWNIIGAVVSFLGAGIISLVLCIVVAVFANKDKKALTAPYAAPAYGVATAPIYTAPQQPTAAPQQPAAPAAAAAAPVAAAVAAEAIAGTAMPATTATAPAAEVVAVEQVAAAEPLISDPAPVTPAVAPAAEAVVPADEAAAEEAIILPDNYIEDAQASVTVIEEQPTDPTDKPEEK